MSPEEREAILLESYARAAEDLRRELEVQLDRLGVLVPDLEESLRNLRRHTSELEARGPARGLRP